VTVFLSPILGRTCFTLLFADFVKEKNIIDKKKHVVLLV
jgi:hypothetical protein